MENQNNLTRSPVRSTTGSFNFTGSLSVGGHLVNVGVFGDNANLSYTNYSQSIDNQSMPINTVNNANLSPELSKETKESEATIIDGNYCCTLGTLEFTCGNVLSFFCFKLEPSIRLSELICCPGKRNKEKKEKLDEIELDIVEENQEVLEEVHQEQEETLIQEAKILQPTKNN
ncbi:hypothetical protein [endosymbiont GvMRE of Glomus versiforme]|uniref:hypothetical protein n=1 Tax=endosymbiont GvMRE of Glomus versiforme TaxID=2039283 RepID=UPI000EE42086|nr:hypothetical protein [endosymbiont GvMRE of Glomus versiforme]RHZ35828.1 hypothetical protein GvMRE_Ic4g33 [endosymbiont GvMRE of Glomus versiforme]